MIKGIPDRPYYLLFSRADYSNMSGCWPVFLKLFLRGKHRDWSHIELFYVDHVGKVTVIAMTPWQVSIGETGLTLNETLKKLKKTSTACVEFVSQTKRDSFQMRGILSCVSIAKAILGLRGMFVIKPKHIYKLVKRKGGKVLWQR